MDPRVKQLVDALGVRKHPPSKIERAGAEEVVNEVLLGGGTLREASDKFREFTGEKISLDAVSRHRRKLLAYYALLEKLNLLADRLLDRAAAPLGEEPGEVARQALLVLAAEAVAHLSADAVEKLSPEALSNIVARLERTRAQSDRVRLDYLKTAMMAEGSINMKVWRRIDEEKRAIARATGEEDELDEEDEDDDFDTEDEIDDEEDAEAGPEDPSPEASPPPQA